MNLQPFLVGAFPYRRWMGESDTKPRIWNNLLRLMRERYGAENLSKLARDTGIGPGSASRIKAQETSIGVDVIEKIAKNFGIEPWQLLAPAALAHFTQDEIDLVMAFRATRETRETAPVVRLPQSSHVKSEGLRKTTEQKRRAGDRVVRTRHTKGAD